MDEKQLEAIESYLSSINDSKIQIALCHHHPIEHSRWELGVEDTIELGGQLLDQLNKYKFDLLIHGHKHDPWLRYSPGNNDSLPIFSAGSFSAISNLILTSAKNTFHHIKLTKQDNKKACGHIRTWEYLPATGWRRADSGDHFFPPNTGFGYRGNIQELVDKSIKVLNEGNGEFLQWDKFKQRVMEVQYLTPDDCVEFRNCLSKNGFITHPELPKEPKFIGKPHIPN